MYPTNSSEHRIFKPKEGADETSAPQSLQEVRTEVATNGRRVMTWVMKNARPVNGKKEDEVTRSYGWDPETGQHYIDTGAGQCPATPDHIAAFLDNQGEGRLAARVLAELKDFLGIGIEPAPESAQF